MNAKHCNGFPSCVTLRKLKLFRKVLEKFRTCDVTVSLVRSLSPWFRCAFVNVSPPAPELPQALEC